MKRSALVKKRVASIVAEGCVNIHTVRPKVNLLHVGGLYREPEAVARLVMQQFYPLPIQMTAPLPFQNSETIPPTGKIVTK